MHAIKIMHQIHYTNVKNDKMLVQLLYTCRFKNSI